jgi:GNAT superfamily N-acetyltransferase
MDFSNLETLETLKPEILANELEAAATRPDRDPHEIPILVVDEYTALRTVVASQGRLRYALPVTTPRQSRESDFRREMPFYSVSFACGRTQKDLISYLTDSFTQFLSSEVETTALALADLQRDIENEVHEATQYLTYWSNNQHKHEQELNERQRRLTARQYALATLSLDQGATASGDGVPRAWSRIIEKARTRVRERWLAPGNAVAADFIQEVLGAGRQTTGQSEQLLLLEQVEDLNEFFDPPKPLRLGELRGLTKSEILDVVRQQLFGEQTSDREILVETYDVATEGWSSSEQKVKPKVQAVQIFLRQLAQMYEELGPIMFADDSADGSDDIKGIKGTIRERITNTLAHKCLRFSGKHGVILLAVEKALGSHPSRYVGMLFVRMRPGHHEWDHYVFKKTLGEEFKTQTELPEIHSEVRSKLEQSCELRYLWVPKEYRGKQIGRVLLGEAIRWCRSKPRIHYVRLAVLPQLQTTLNLVSAMGFKPVEPNDFDKEDAKSRVIFEIDLRDVQGLP